MKFIGTKGETIEFKIPPYYDGLEEMTGLKSEPISHGLKLVIDVHDIQGIHEILTEIMLSEILEILDWFKGLLLKIPVKPDLSILHNRFYLNLLKNDPHSKTVRITYDGTVPIPGVGGYSGNIEYFLRTYVIECEMNDNELRNIVVNLIDELHESRRNI